MTARFLSRFPKRLEALQLFWVTIFAVHVWSILNFLYIVPALLVRMEMGEVLGVAAYILAFALLESLLVWCTMLALAFVLPRRWLLEKIVLRGAILVLVSAVWMIPVHYSMVIIPAFFSSPLKTQVYWFLVLGSYLLAVWDLPALADRHLRLEAGVRAFVDRLGPLAWFYLLADLAGLLVLGVRLFLR